MNYREIARSIVRCLAVLTLVAGISGIATPVFAQTRLYANDFLFNGQSIVDPNCRFRLTMQVDGNLVLYDINRPLWASNTVGVNGFVVMQADGNLVMYNWSGKPVWATGTWRFPGSHVAMQHDGNAVVYYGSTPLWASNTVVGGEQFGITPCMPMPSITRTYRDWDRPGGDYVGYFMSAAEYSHCAYWCSQDGRCKAFTYVPPGVQSSSAVCWLKDQLTGFQYRPGMVSGHIVR